MRVCHSPQVRRRLLGPLLVDRHLALGLHVVEHDHLLAADDGHLAHLVRVEPRQVHVRDLAAREAEEAEDDVLDARVEGRAAARPRPRRLLVEEVEDHRQVVHAERPERVLVLADDAEVDAVAVDAEHVAELARVDELLHLAHARVVEQQVPRHQHEPARVGERDELAPSRTARIAGGFSTKTCLPASSACLRERVVRRDGRRDARPRRARGRRAAPRSRRSTRACRDSAGEAARGAPRGVAEPARGRRACRSSARGSCPSRRARPGRPARARSQLADLAFRRSWPRSRCGGRRRAWRVDHARRSRSRCAR